MSTSSPRRRETKGSAPPTDRTTLGLRGQGEMGSDEPVPNEQERGSFLHLVSRNTDSSHNSTNRCSGTLAGIRLAFVKVHVGRGPGGLNDEPSTFQTTTAVLLCLPMMAMVEAQAGSATQAAKPEQTTTIVGCLVRGIPTRRAANGVPKSARRTQTTTSCARRRWRCPSALRSPSVSRARLIRPRQRASPATTASIALQVSSANNYGRMSVTASSCKGI